MTPRRKSIPISRNRNRERGGQKGTTSRSNLPLDPKGEVNGSSLAHRTRLKALIHVRLEEGWVWNEPTKSRGMTVEKSIPKVTMACRTDLCVFFASLLCWWKDGGFFKSRCSILVIEFCYQRRLVGWMARVNRWRIMAEVGNFVVACRGRFRQCLNK